MGRLYIDSLPRRRALDLYGSTGVGGMRGETQLNRSVVVAPRLPAALPAAAAAERPDGDSHLATMVFA
jgi:hypothetical protein